MIPYEEALRIATEFAKEVACTFPNRIEAVLAIGSLGSDYYRPGQSDIDTAIITNFARSDMFAVEEKIERIANNYQQNYHVPKGFGAIVFAKEQLYPPYIGTEELTQEILRLQRQSKLLYGDLDIQKIPTPDAQAIKNDMIHFQKWSDSQPAFTHTEQTMANSTLIALKRYLLLKHNIIEFNKFKVVDLYLQNNPPFVNEELFAFVTRYIYQQPYEWNDEICQKYTQWHDELYRVINNAVLYN